MIHGAGWISIDLEKFDTHLEMLHFDPSLPREDCTGITSQLVAIMNGWAETPN